MLCLTGEGVGTKVPPELSSGCLDSVEWNGELDDNTHLVATSL